MIELVMDFPVMFPKVLNTHLHRIYGISVLLSRVSSFVVSYFANFFFFDKALGWNKEKIITIGHSYGAMLGLIVKSYLTIIHLSFILNIVCSKLFK